MENFVTSYEAIEDTSQRRRLINGLGRKQITFIDVQGGIPDALDHPRRFSILDARLRKELGKIDADIAVDIHYTDSRALVLLDTERLGNQHYRFSVNRKRLFSATSYSFVMILLFTAALAQLVSLGFLRNQMRPIRKLAYAAERYGKGEADVALTLQGASEVKAATNAFIDMRARISNTVSRRTAMLNGISHDLRTPLTRLRLAVEMMDNQDSKTAMQYDLDEMETMIDSYLAFARGEPQTPLLPISITSLVKEVCQHSLWPSISIEIGKLPHAVPLLRRNAMTRALQNLIANAAHHASHLHISGTRREDKVLLWLDDDGPGIPADKRALALRPFQRLDPSRTTGTIKQMAGNTGLGLSIVQDLIVGQGGALRLMDSPLGGLRVEIELRLERQA